MKTFPFMISYYIRAIVTPRNKTPRNIGKDTEFSHWLYQGCYMLDKEQNYSPSEKALRWLLH